MTHQIPPHLAFCTPGQNFKKKKARNKSRGIKEKQTNTKTITYFLMNLKERKGKLLHCAKLQI